MCRRAWWLPVGLLLGLILFREPLLLAAGRFLVVEDEALVPADLIHPLGGGFDRLDYALELYRQGYGERLFITGGEDAAAYRAYVRAAGVPAGAVEPTRSEAVTTYEEAVELRRFLEGDESVHSVIVVSHPYHMRRAGWTFRRVVGRRAGLQLAHGPVNPYWWREAGLRRRVLEEYLKLGYYYVRYGLGGCPAKLGALRGGMGKPQPRFTVVLPAWSYMGDHPTIFRLF